MKSTFSSHGSDDNPSIKPLKLRSTLKAFDDSVLSEDDPPSEPDTRKEPFRVSSFRITKATDGKSKSEQQGEAKQEPAPESKSAASAASPSNLDFLLDSDSDLEPDSASRPNHREHQRMGEPSTASEGTSYAFSSDQGGPLPVMMAPTALEEYALVPAPGDGYDPFETTAYDAFNAGYGGYPMDPSYGQYPIQYVDPYSTAPSVYAPPQLVGYDGYGMPIMQYPSYPAQYGYAMPYGYAVPPAGYGYPQPMPQPQDWADTLYKHPVPELQQYTYPNRRGSLRSNRSDTVDARAAHAAAQAVRRASLGSSATRPTFGSAPTGRTPSTPTRGEYDGAPKARTTPRKPTRSTPVRATPSVSSYMDAASRATGSEANTAATPSTAPPKQRKSKKVREAARSDRSATMSVASTDDGSVIDMIPGEVGRLMAASKLLEHKERLVSVVDVHDAMLALVRAVAMRDSYTTLRDILSDVPLAVMCMPKPNNDTLTNVISGLTGIRDMFVAQIAAAATAIEEDPGTSGAIPVKLSGGAAAVLPVPRATPSLESASTITAVSKGSQGVMETPTARKRERLAQLAMVTTPESYLFPSGQPPVAYYGDSDFGDARGLVYRRENSLDSAELDDVNVEELLDSFPVEVRNNFECLQAVWKDKLLKEEELGREVLSEKVVMLRQMWESAQDTACKVLPLAADTRSTYAGQMRRLEQLAIQDKDTEWNIPSSRSDLRWHAMIRLYNAFCRHTALPRFKLSASLPRPLALYLRALVKGSTEEEREGVDNLDEWLTEANTEPCDKYVSGGVDWDKIAEAASSGKTLAELGLTEDGEINTHSRKLGQLLRDPGAWWSGFQNQWEQNQLVLAKRWWKRFERGQPDSDEEMLERFQSLGLRWRQGKTPPAWRDISTGSGSQWGGGSWGACVSWVHTHLFESAKAANTQWREFSARRLVFRGLNEQMRLDVYNTMLLVGTSLETTEADVIASHEVHRSSRVTLFRDEIDRLSDQEGELCKQLEAEAAKDTNVKKVLEVLGRRVRPMQLSTHQKLLGAHMEAIGPLLQEVSAFAESVVQDCVADRVYATVTAGHAGDWFDQQSTEGVE